MIEGVGTKKTSEIKPRYNKWVVGGMLALGASIVGGIAYALIEHPPEPRVLRRAEHLERHLAEPDRIRYTQSGLPVVTAEVMADYGTRVIVEGTSFREYTDELRRENPNVGLHIESSLAALKGTPYKNIATRAMMDMYGKMAMQSEAYRESIEEVR
tara:strand:+ start:1324 stop:1791 length:468 start_codon:yes stop_codon:yes gene_type:complete